MDPPFFFWGPKRVYCPTVVRFSELTDFSEVACFPLWSTLNNEELTRFKVAWEKPTRDWVYDFIGWSVSDPYCWSEWQPNVSTVSLLFLNQELILPGLRHVGFQADFELAEGETDDSHELILDNELQLAVRFEHLIVNGFGLYFVCGLLFSMTPSSEMDFWYDLSLWFRFELFSYTLYGCLTAILLISFRWSWNKNSKWIWHSYNKTFQNFYWYKKSPPFSVVKGENQHYNLMTDSLEWDTKQIVGDWCISTKLSVARVLSYYYFTLFWCS